MKKSKKKSPTPTKKKSSKKSRQRKRSINIDISPLKDEKIMNKIDGQAFIYVMNVKILLIIV